ncbi:MAG: hypothetical protein ACRDJL_05630 [Actinomycetota bacterium]
MTGYQLFLLLVIIIWPFAIGAMLFAMSRIEGWIERVDAATPQEAGLEPVAGEEREVRIVFGDRVVGENEPGAGRIDTGETPAVN